jgi:hypothetical protein
MGFDSLQGFSDAIKTESQNTKDAMKATEDDLGMNKSSKSQQPANDDPLGLR